MDHESEPEGLPYISEQYDVSTSGENLESASSSLDEHVIGTITQEDVMEELLQVNIIALINSLINLSCCIKE